MNLVSNPKVELRGHVKAKILPAVHRKRWHDKFRYMFDEKGRQGMEGKDRQVKGRKVRERMGCEARTRREGRRERKRKTKERKEKSFVSYPEGNQQDPPREGQAHSRIPLSGQSYAILNGSKQSLRWDIAQWKGGSVGVKAVCDSVSEVSNPK